MKKSFITQKHLDKLQEQLEVENVFLANSLQQGLIFHNIKHGGVDGAYITQLTWDYYTNVDPDTFLLAWEHAQENFAALRLRFSWAEEIVQVINSVGEIKWNYFDLSNLNKGRREDKIKEIHKKDRSTPYNLENGPMFRVYFFKQKDNHFTCFFSNHSLILDGWSYPILINFIHRAYYEIINHGEAYHETPAAFESAQEYLMQNKDKDKNSWIAKLDHIENDCNLSGIMNLNLNHQNLYLFDFVKNQEELSILINEEIFKRLKKVFSPKMVTSNSVLLYCWNKVLNTYGNSKHTVVGITISGRSIPVNGIELGVGPFIKTLPFVVDHSRDRDISVIDKIIGIQEDIVWINEHTNVNLVDLQKNSERLFNTLFVYENFPNSKTSDNVLDQSLTMREVVDKINYPLGVMVREFSDHLKITVKFAGEILDKDMICKMLKTYLFFVDQVVNDPYQKVEDLKKITNEEVDEVFTRFNNIETQKGYTGNLTVIDFLSEAFTKNHDKIAVVAADKHLTYYDLRVETDCLAHYLTNDLGIKKNDVVGLFLDRSSDVITSFISVMKTGAIYTPISFNLPNDRIEYILKDSQARYVITTKIGFDKLKSFLESNEETSGLRNKIKFIILDDEKTCQTIKKWLNVQYKWDICQQDSAYVIYTSGSSGKPKGVIIHHGGLVNLAYSQGSVLELENNGNSKKCLWFSDYVFDAHVWEIYSTLVYGNTLYIPDDSTRIDYDRLKKYIEVNGVEIATLPPAFLNSINLLSLKILILAGETPRTDVLDAYYNQGTMVVNAYGPTEVTVCSTLNIYQRNGNCNIGKPFPGNNCFILDKNLKPLPIGAVGELCVSGKGVGHGYLHQDALTNEKFVINHYRTKDKAFGKIYRTGDLAYLSKNGDLFYCGRNDDQIKLRGFRIEPDEIREVLRSHKSIDDCAVTVENISASGSEDKRLVVFYVKSFEDKSNFNDKDVKELRSYLKEKLPYYMIPDLFFSIDKLPMTINGKIDFKKLNISLDFKKKNRSIDLTTNEKKFAKILSDILGTHVEDEIDFDCSFFELGGNSLLLIKLKDRLQEEFSLENLMISDFFKYPTLKELGRQLWEKEEDVKTIKKENMNVFSMGCELERDIAIVGISGAFSGSSSLGEYWQNILSGKQCCFRLKPEELKLQGVETSVIDDSDYVPVSGTLKDFGLFDPEFWNISLVESKYFDPQIRKFLEHCWQALESGGQILKKDCAHVGVFAGMGGSQYYENRLRPLQNANNYVEAWNIETLNNTDFFATRVSYLLGLTGVSLNINTACSTSLVAIIEACKNLTLRTCDIALAGGAGLIMPENHGYQYKTGMVLSLDGECRAFDEKATGTVPGSGVGAVVLKRLSDAEKDGDYIYGVIKGYASNNDGNDKVGFTAPSTRGQTRCIKEAYRMAGISIDSINYIECHGTATALGDSIEVAALKDSFSTTSRGSNKCYLGSVKANIGHAGSAAGVAGFIKAAKMVEEKVIPPQAAFSKLNENLDLDQSIFAVNTEFKRISDEKATVGVSSFGIGGTNAHVVIQSYNNNEKKQITASTSEHYIFPVSGKTVQACEANKKSLLEYLINNKNISLGDIAYTLQNRRPHFPFRDSIVCENISDAISLLDKNKGHSNKAFEAPQIVFQFSGQGAQYSNMGLELVRNFPVFKETMEKIDHIFSSCGRAGLLDIIYPGNCIDDRIDLINQTYWTQPSLFSICISLAKLYESFGISPTVLLGHSIGELVAATMAEIFSLNDACKIVLKRSELMEAMPRGGMLSILCTEEILTSYLEDGLSISVYNTNKNHVVSGTTELIEKLSNKLEKDKILSIKIQTSHAFHSPMMRDASAELEKFIKTINIKTPKIPFVSNVTGEFISDKNAISPSYWAAQLLNPVRYSDCIKTVLREINNPIIVEIGPGEGLSSFFKSVAGDGVKTVLSIPKKANSKENNYFYSSLASLWKAGVHVEWEKYGAVSGSLDPYLPTYQFDHKCCLVPFVGNSNTIPTNEADGPMMEPREEISHFQSSFQHKTKCNFSNQFEQSVAEEFFLHLGSGDISKTSNFFELGGNSLSLISLLNNLNRRYSAKITLAEVNRVPTVTAIAGLFSNEESSFNLLIPLNTKKLKKKTLFMLHSGVAGPEVYADLAIDLNDYFNCVGINPYNLYSENKITDLDKLASLYISKIDKWMFENYCDEYILLGWSFGGVLAAKMGSILESREKSNIKIILIDAIFNDEELLKIKSNPIEVSRIEEISMSDLKNRGGDKHYIEKERANFRATVALENNQHLFKIQTAKTLLFKATKIDSDFGASIFDKINNLVMNSKYNNFDRICSDKNKIQLINTSANHNTILLEKEILVKHILDFVSFDFGVMKNENDL